MWSARTHGLPVSALPVPDDRDPLTSAEVARLVDVDPPAVARAINRGELRAHTRGGVRRWIWRRGVAGETDGRVYRIRTRRHGACVAGRVMSDRRADGRRQCTATSKRSHARCKALAMRGAHTCRNHGGRQAQVSIGAANPNYKTGRFSRWMHALPSRYSADYVAALQDPQLLSLQHEIAITDARLAELMAQLPGASGTWQDVKGSYDALIAAMSREDQPAIRVALVSLRDVAHGNLSNERQWREWSRLGRSARVFVRKRDTRRRKSSNSLTGVSFQRFSGRF